MQLASHNYGHGPLFNRVMMHHDSSKYCHMQLGTQCLYGMVQSWIGFTYICTLAPGGFPHPHFSGLEKSNLNFPPTSVMQAVSREGHRELTRILLTFPTMLHVR